MKSYRSIEQLYHLFKRARSYADFNSIPYAELETVEFTGTVKLHGTNAGIVIDALGATASAQSRTRPLSVTSDNYGFAFFVQSIPQLVIDSLYSTLNPTGVGTLTIFGEWCGSGIQKSVAIAEVPRHFVMFAACVDGEYVEFDYNIHFADVGVYNIGMVPQYNCVVNFAAEEQTALEEYVSKLTSEVEDLCPWAHNIFNISGVGEGIVWHRPDRPWDSNFFFKTKGEKHSVRKSNSNTIVSVDPERVASIQECVDVILTDNRMLQMVQDFQLEYTHSNIGAFLKAVCSDCAKEEIDVILSNNLTWNDVSRVIQFRARNWFLENIKKLK